MTHRFARVATGTVSSKFIERRCTWRLRTRQRPQAGYSAQVSEAYERVRLFVPGTPASMNAWNIGSLDPCLDVDWIENDGTFGESFSFGTVAADIVEAIDDAPGALLLTSRLDLRAGHRQIVAAVERLRDAGALAVRIEQSKMGWDIARWLELFAPQAPSAWHSGAVVLLDGETSMQSCGMHAFSLPDVNVSLDVERREIRELVSSLNVYQLAEDPVLLSGQTFSPAPGRPRRLIQRWPDVEYPPEHACHNPYGVWRLGPANSTARSIGELVLTFIPALRAVLTALHSEQPEPLTEQQVLAARDQGACIAMKPRDAQALERQRGYADLDPELVWVQWQSIQAQRERE